MKVGCLKMGGPHLVFQIEGSWGLDMVIQFCPFQKVFRIVKTESKLSQIELLGFNMAIIEQK